MIDELGNWRQRRHKIGKKYFEAYHEIIPKSEPVEDYDDRNALYCVYVTFFIPPVFVCSEG